MSDFHESVVVYCAVYTSIMITLVWLQVRLGSK